MERTFAYDLDRRFRPLWWALGVREGQPAVRLTEGGHLVARYGRFSVDTPLTNVVGAEVTGPYRWWRSVGLRLSLRDDGVTFGTTDHRGVCLRFAERVPPVVGWRPHSGLTVTVADPEALVAALGGGRGR